MIIRVKKLAKSIVGEMQVDNTFYIIHSLLISHFTNSLNFEFLSSNTFIKIIYAFSSSMPTTKDTLVVS